MIQQKANWSLWPTFELVAETRPRLAGELCRFRLLAGGEEHRVAGLDAGGARDLRLRLGRNELRDRSLAGELAALLLEHDVAEAGGALGAGPFVELVEERARLRGGARRRDRAHDAAGDDDVLEGVEGHVLAGEERGHVGDDERVAQIRLVRAVFQHRVGVADAREDRRHLAALGELVEDAADDGLERRPDVLLRDEAHLDVELVELAGQAVGARILVAEARRDLEIAVEAGDHDQLLVLLRRLRQGVEAAGVEARGNEKIPCALGT